MEDLKSNDSGGTREKSMLKKYVRLRRTLDRVAVFQKKINEEFDLAQTELINYLTDMGKKSTGKYEELGSVTIVEAKALANYKKENEEKVWDFIRANHGEDCIKTAIHPSTFRGFVREMIGAGVKIPEFIEIYYQPQVKYFKP